MHLRGALILYHCQVSYIDCNHSNSWPVSDDIKAKMRLMRESIVTLEEVIQVAEAREEDETRRFR
jgi:hypothetical protein